MGEVWAAKHSVTRRDVALKFLTVDQGVMSTMRRRFLREARAAAAVNHPSVIQIHDVFELQDETPVMVMDLLVGESLGDKLAREGALSVAETARLLAPVVSAVGTAHALGIVHRDLKPENIFLVRAMETDAEVKVLDFGIAKLGSTMELGQTGAVTGTGAVLGTPYYMALEQAYGEKDIDHRADIWSLGVVLYECLAGRRPIDGDNFGQIVKFLNHGTIPSLAELAPHVPADVDQLVMRMLQRAREDRPQDLREVLTILRRHTSATARTFGGPRAPQASEITEAPAPVRDAAVTIASSPGTQTSRSADPDMATIEVATAEHPQEIVRERVSTGKRVAPVSVTLADDTAEVASEKPAASRRNAWIAGAVLVVGIAAVTFGALTLRASRTPQMPAGGAALTTTATLPVPTTPAMAVVTAAPEATVVPAEPTPSADPTTSPAASGGPVPSVSGLRPLRPGPLPSAKPAASGVASAQPAPSSAAKPKGGLVDEPPF
ncbi:Serine/threonine protein kinase [Minicystis rosea]|nr:Serine/threonine protein kinase [Minicystis rosea]